VYFRFPVTGHFDSLSITGPSEDSLLCRDLVIRTTTGPFCARTSIICYYKPTRQMPINALTGQVKSPQRPKSYRGLERARSRLFRQNVSTISGGDFVRRMLPICELFFAFLLMRQPAIVQSATAVSHTNSSEGFVVTPDGVRLYFHKMGAGRQIVPIPADLFLDPAFARLAPGRTLIFYDMRDRGRSDPVADPRHITIQDDCQRTQQKLSSHGAWRIRVARVSAWWGPAHCWPY
jgi:hypothetical protein